MEFRVNYVIVGLFVLIIAASTLATGLWLSAGLQNKTYDTYEILMYEPVSGLNEQAPVKFNGVQVGYVQSIDLNVANPRQVILLTQIESGTPITKSTVATLMAQGITGVTYIGLKAKTPNADPLEKLPGHEYPIIPSSPSLLVELDSAIRGLSSNVDDISVAIKRVLSSKNIKAFSSLLNHTNNILGNIDNNQAHITQILTNTDTVMKKLADSSAHFPQTVKNFDKAMVSFNTASLDTSEFLSEAGYAVRQWSNQIAPTTFNLVYQITRLTSDFEEIAGELKQQPSLLIRGKAELPLGPGEK